MTGRDRLTVAHGMGGSGKSVLATAFARSTATRLAFGDGVCWLAPEPDARLEHLLASVGRQLGGSPERWKNHEDAVNGLRERLQGRRVLLVLDSLEASLPVETLLGVLDTDTRLLVTTRMAGMATDLGARAVGIGELRPDEAARQLADWAGCGLGGGRCAK